MTLRSAAGPLPARLVETEARRDRHVERVDRALQRYLDQTIARFAREPAQAGPFPAQYPRDRAGKIGFEQTLAAAGVGADDPHAALLELAQAPREVGHADDRHRVRRARRGLGDRRVDADGAIPWDDDRMRAERVGAAHAGAQVMRVGNAVEYEQQRWPDEVVEYLAERAVRIGGIDDCDHALMLVVAGERRQSRVVDRVHGDCRSFGALDQLARAPIVTRRGGVNGAHALRPRAQPRDDRVKSG